MPKIKRLIPALASVALATGLSAPGATASSSQEALIQDNVQLSANTAATLQTMRTLGATRVKVAIDWNTIAPSASSFQKPKHFDPTNPAGYPAANWTFLDNVVRQAHADGLGVAVTLTGPAPLWATGTGMPHSSNCPCGQWKPSDAAFQAFVHAVGERYDGSYRPNGASTALPRVSWWSLWNEPNYGPDLAPQATHNDAVEVSPAAYRGLLNAAWKGLSATGHTPSRDTILIGETAPRGRDHPIGNFSGIKPLRFLRALYCVDSAYRQLRGVQAALRSCPTTAAGSRRFRAANPALFAASGYADHPYAQGVSPVTPTYACGSGFCHNGSRSDPDYADFAEIGRLERTLDRLNRSYGSGTRFPVWNTEYGFWTNPPDRSHEAISAAKASLYMNWAEYLSYRQPRLRSYSQYLLLDPPTGTFADGLELPSGKPKATYDAYAVPLYMPKTTAAHAGSLLVWGDLRAAAYALSDTGLQQQAKLQFHRGSHGAFSTVRTVTVTNQRGYFAVTQPFAASGSVRIAWTRPGGSTVYSRTQTVRVG